MIQKKNKWTNLHPRSNQNWMVSKVLKHLENLLNIVPSFGPVFSLISIQEGRRKSLKCHEKVIFSWSLCKKNQCFFFLDFHSNVAYLRVGLLKVPAFPWTKISKHPRTFNSLPQKLCFIILESWQNKRTLLNSKRFSCLSGYAALWRNVSIGFTFFHLNPILQNSWQIWIIICKKKRQYKKRSSYLLRIPQSTA